jgi:hypothetical protein
MKRILVRFLVSAIALLALATCSNPVFEALQSDQWGLVGRWTNPDYYDMFGLPRCYVLELKDDGTIFIDNGTGATAPGTYTVESVSSSGTTRTFEIHFVVFDESGGVSDEEYARVRITDLTSFEGNIVGSLPYPTVIDSAGGGYATYTLD